MQHESLIPPAPPYTGSIRGEQATNRCAFFETRDIAEANAESSSYTRSSYTRDVDFRSLIPLLTDDRKALFTGTSLYATPGLRAATSARIRHQKFSHRALLTLDTKRCFDIVLATVAIIFLAPLLVAIALAIRADSRGPAVFRQARTGLNGKPFRIYKFRTMIVQEDGDVIQQVKRRDKRVTRVGRFLRKISADELPQLLNVLTGDMSMVGPRPHALAHDEYYSSAILSYKKRFAVKPGITGWAQVNGARGETPEIQDMTRRIKFDLFYIQNAGLVLDIRILIMTFFAEITRRSDAF
jgi:exopolysaccharide biosynthesis polyprenyl glycosylphosphotransferase